MIHEVQPHIFDNHFVADILPLPSDMILCYQGNTMLVDISKEEMEIPRKGQLLFPENVQFTYLFSLDGISCFLAMHGMPEFNSNFEYREIGFFRNIKHKETGWLTIVGFHLKKWYDDHKFCGKCGTQTQHKISERALVCPVCNNIYFPVISPAIIVAIIANNKILLARNANFSGGWYSLIAGYVDVGETIEQTVLREVKEETGLDVYDIKYYASQPWSLSGSLMLGFVARADINQKIEVDGKEIVTAEWFSPDNLPQYPSNASIAGEMIDKFKKGMLLI